MTPRSLLLSTALLATMGCASRGPGTIAEDSFDYAQAISRAEHRQTLLAIVKLRYDDLPTFLTVGQVVAGYNYEVTGSLGGKVGVDDGIYSGESTVGVGGRYVERPTISYQPLRGEAYVRTVLTPLQPVVLLALLQSGWEAEPLFRLLVESINGSHNRPTAPEGGTFERWAVLLGRLQAQDGLSMRIERTDEGGYRGEVVFHRDALDPQTQDDLAVELVELGLAPDVESCRLVYGTNSGAAGAIAVQTRSVLQIMSALSSSVEVPDAQREHAREVVGEEQDRFLVHAGAEPPADEPWLSIRYRDHHYWIAGRDTVSRRTFFYVTLLLALAEPGSSKLPGLVISAGG